MSQSFRQGGPYQGTRLVAEGGDHGNLNFGAVVGGGVTGSGHNVWGKLLPDGAFALVFISNEDTPTDVRRPAATRAPAGPALRASLHAGRQPLTRLARAAGGL